MEKRNKKVKWIIVAVAIVLLALEGYFVYCNTNKKLVELQDNLDNLSSEIFTIHNKNVDILYYLNIDLNNENLKVSFEDENYISYEYDELSQYTKYGYHVFDKKNSIYIKKNVSDDDIITYFNKIDGEYYYLVLTVNDKPVTNIYKIDGTLLETFDGGVFNSYDAKTKTFTFDMWPETVDETTSTWSPIK